MGIAVCMISHCRKVHTQTLKVAIGYGIPQAEVLETPHAGDPSLNRSIMFTLSTLEKKNSYEYAVIITLMFL